MRAGRGATFECSVSQRECLSHVQVEAPGKVRQAYRGAESQMGMSFMFAQPECPNVSGLLSFAEKAM